MAPGDPPGPEAPFRPGGPCKHQRTFNFKSTYFLKYQQITQINGKRHVTMIPGAPLLPLKPFRPGGPFFPDVPGKPGSP